MLGLHGWGRTHRDLLTCLDGMNAVALDLPGFGASPAPTQPAGAAAYADLVEPVLDECAARLVIVGHSFGGRVALELAIRRPDVVGALVLCGVPLLRRCDRRAPRLSLGYRVVRSLHRRRILSDSAMERMRQRYGSADYRSAVGVMRDVLVVAVNETYEERLGLVEQPVELVWGSDDDAVPVEVARRAGEMFADAQLRVLSGVGHFVPTETPDALAAAVHSRLAQLS